MNVFSPEELSVLESVYEKFKNSTAAVISAISHNEDAWEMYYGTNKLIDFREAFTLKAL